jgi:putative pyruvate formate lyase activating enzyme
LVMPGDVAGTEEILRFLADEVSPETYVNMMAQYHPAGRVTMEKFREKYIEINRPVSPEEFAHAVKTAERLGLRLDARRARG